MTSPRDRSNRISVQGTQSSSSSENCLHGVCSPCGFLKSMNTSRTDLKEAGHGCSISSPPLP